MIVTEKVEQVMKLALALIFGILVFGTFKALLRVFGLHFAGDRDRRTCANCGIENLEHLATANGHWLLWNATSEHVAPCGLPCANGIKPNRQEYVNNLSAIHRGVRCKRCGPP
jgi:hypothetical protein